VVKAKMTEVLIDTTTGLPHLILGSSGEQHCVDLCTSCAYAVIQPIDFSIVWVRTAINGWPTATKNCEGFGAVTVLISIEAHQDSSGDMRVRDVTRHDCSVTPVE
jgi:hypothetical protein